MEKTLKEWRLHRNLTQEQLADLTGKSQYQISTWESGVHEPSYNVMMQMREALKLKKSDVILLPKQLSKIESEVK